MSAASIAPRVRVAYFEVDAVAAVAADDRGLFDTTREDTYLSAPSVFDQQLPVGHTPPR